MAELASRFVLHPTMIHQWQNALPEGVPLLFALGASRQREGGSAETLKTRHARIGELRVAMIFVEQVVTVERRVRRAMVERAHPHLSVTRRSHLLSLSRSSWYYTPFGESAENLALMAAMGRQF